jgi:hypothetical protein
MRALNSLTPMNVTAAVAEKVLEYDVRQNLVGIPLPPESSS